MQAVTASHKFRGQRALRIGVRTIHIGAGAMVLGAVAFRQAPGGWAPLLFVSGLGLVADDLYRYRLAWFRFAQAWIVLAKIGVLGWGIAVPEHRLVALWGVLIIGSVISHAPGNWRQYALWGPPGPCANRDGAPCRPASTAARAPAPHLG